MVSRTVSSLPLVGRRLAVATPDLQPGWLQLQSDLGLPESAGEPSGAGQLEVRISPVAHQRGRVFYGIPRCLESWIRSIAKFPLNTVAREGAVSIFPPP